MDTCWGCKWPVVFVLSAFGIACIDLVLFAVAEEDKNRFANRKTDVRIGGELEDGLTAEEVKSEPDIGRQNLLLGIL